MRYFIPIFLIATIANADSQWPGFRGDGTSISHAKNVPLHWSETKNLAWSIKLPGYGQSSPVIWNGKAFATSVEGDTKQTLHVTAVDLKHGTIAWKKSFQGTQGVKDSDYVSKAAPTPVVDVNHVYAFFESGDVIAMSHDGKLKWQRSLVKDYGPFEGNHGIGSSLAQTAKHIIVLVDHGGECYMAALDKQSGKTAWRVKRSQRVAWSSPIVFKHEGQERIVVSSNGSVEEFDAKDGNRLWFVEGFEGNTVPSPTVTASHVFIGSNKLNNNLAIERGEAGTIAWRAGKVTTTFCSPLVVRGRYYTVNRAGVAFCVDAKSGTTLWQERIASSCWASPVAAEGRVYFFCKNGSTVVVEDGASFEKLAQNELPTDGRVYGVAIADGQLLIRTGSTLRCIQKDTK